MAGAFVSMLSRAVYLRWRLFMICEDPPMRVHLFWIRPAS